MRLARLPTRDEHGFGFKSGGFSAFLWIWIGYYKFCLTGFDNLVFNFFAIFSAVLELYITAFNQ